MYIAIYVSQKYCTWVPTQKLATMLSPFITNVGCLFAVAGDVCFASIL